MTLKNRSKLCPSDPEKLVHAFIPSILDNRNALFIGNPGTIIQKLKYIQNTTARILMRVRKRKTFSLHWLPVSFKINYRVSLPTYKINQQTCTSPPAGTDHTQACPNTLPAVCSCRPTLLSSKPWGIEPSALLHYACGTAFLTI